MKERIKGITLISLVITIVIMIILAAVAINLIIGKNGVFNKSKEAVSIYNDKKEQEAKDMKEEEKIYSLYIQDLDDLIAFRDSVNAGNKYADTTVYLVNDIDMQGSEENPWTPIGVGYKDNGDYVYFSGDFQGNNHTLSNLYVNINKNRFGGLFGCTVLGSIINLNVSGEIVKNEEATVTCYNKYYAGGIVAIDCSTKIDSCVSNLKCNTKNKYIDFDHYEDLLLGGICGEVNSASIENCINYSEINNEMGVNGGIVGSTYNSIVNRCFNYGKLSTVNNYGDAGNPLGTIGGISGEVFNNSVILNSSNYGEIYEAALNTYNINGSGGIVGDNKGLVYGCYNEGKVSGNRAVGGIAGFGYYEVYDNSQDIKLKYLGVYNCYNTGEVGPSNSEHSDFIGGIVGHSRLTVANCYNLGKVVKGTGDSCNGILGELSFDGYIKNHTTYETTRIDITDFGYTKIKNCYVLDNKDIPTSVTIVTDKDKNRINDISSYSDRLEVTRKSEQYMKSKEFVNDLLKDQIIKCDCWNYRENAFPSLYGYNKNQVGQFYK